MARSATRIFCLMNGRDLHHSVDDAEALVVAVAADDLEASDVAASIAAHLVASPDAR